MTHTPGEWTDGKPSDSIVSQSGAGVPFLTNLEHDCVEYYGGYLIAESVAPCNKALLKAAPDLLEACEALRHAIKGIIQEWDDYEMIAALDHHLYDDGMKKADAAIAKATEAQ